MTSTRRGGQDSHRDADIEQQVMTPLADELLVHLCARNRRAAVDYIGMLVNAGMTVQELVDIAFTPALAEVGRLWQSGVWSVADEHAATAVAESALLTASARAARLDAKDEIVVACVEGEWHSLAARMVAQTLDEQGWQVRYLGSSSPNADVVDLVRRHPPAATVLSCTTVTALPALLVTVQALHELDSPVFVGGGALGRDAVRAALLGADGWAASAGRAADLLGRPAAEAGPAAAMSRLAAYHELQAVIPAWADEAMDEVVSRIPAVAGFPAHAHDGGSSYLEHLLDVAGISVLLADDALVREQTEWLTAVFAARAVPKTALGRGLESLLVTVPDEPAVSAVLPALVNALEWSATERSDELFS
jgi:methanogenic corrinoid protein MtbC1